MISMYSIVWHWRSDDSLALKTNKPFCTFSSTGLIFWWFQLEHGSRLDILRANVSILNDEGGGGCSPGNSSSSAFLLSVLLHSFSNCQNLFHKKVKIQKYHSLFRKIFHWDVKCIYKLGCVGLKLHWMLVVIWVWNYNL